MLGSWGHEHKIEQGASERFYGGSFEQLAPRKEYQIEGQRLQLPMLAV